MASGRRQEDCSTRQSTRKRAPFPIVINAIAARQLGFASPEMALGQALQSRAFEMMAYEYSSPKVS